ncbi:hypothetical protein [Prosthecobacter sp.]|uniref:hypothetical protein n=1 Tax=Prosthecobacter sp. TaxID=1965333 RepID=UPI0037831ADD
MKLSTSRAPALGLLTLALISPAQAGTYFSDEVWPKVGVQACLKCHKAGGDAEESRFVLQDPARDQTPGRHASLIHNEAAFSRMAKLLKDGESRLLLKATGKLEHEGEEVLKPGSTGFRILESFVKKVDLPQSPTPAKEAPPFFAGVSMLDDARLLRRVTLSLSGRLPTEAELKRLNKPGAFSEILDAVMKEDAFYDRLREGFNDIFLTLGADGGDSNILSYDHFSKTRNWFQTYDLSHIQDEKERRQAGYKLARQYREALLGEPMKLIEHIVRNDRPFTEIVTADYIMVTPYTSRGYGNFEEIKARFKNAEDPFEYIPVKLNALVGRNKADNQDSATGFYPHAGLLSTFQYLRRYPTTETNRNRLRARMYFQHFLGVDVLELAARVSDAAATTAKYKVPTMEAAECVVCHKTLDPIAGMFQDYWRFEGVYGKRKEGWFTDMFGAGCEGEILPEGERWRALQWLGEHTAKDPRFAVAMVEHVYYILTGRKVLLPPKDLDDPGFAAKYRAHQEQRAVIETIARKFAKTGFNLKQVFKDWVATDFYRANGLTTAALKPERQAELDDVGIVRMLAPEQLERKIAAVFGRPWGRLNDQLAMLYGGIDSKEVTERAADPSGAMGSLQRIIANDVACKETALDFSRPAGKRLLFANMEPDVVPGTADADARIRRTLTHLHERLLGRVDEAEVERSFQLFAGIVKDAAEQRHAAEENYFCRQGLEQPVADPHYTVRAWRAVVTYLLRQYDFLYE